MHWKKIDSGRFITGDFANFDTGMILPRATPPWSGTRHSISSMLRSDSHSVAASRPSTPRSVRSVDLSVFFFLLILAHVRFPSAGEAEGDPKHASATRSTRPKGQTVARYVPGSGPDDRTGSHAPHAARGHAKEASEGRRCTGECPQRGVRVNCDHEFRRREPW